MGTRRLKILTVQFRSLGDTVLSIPSLMALRDRFPDCELHALVAEPAVPLLRHHPVLDRVWGLPRVRGSARLTRSWPILRALRAERFDRTVDFVGNDRSAITSFLCGGRERLGVLKKGGFWGRRFCYTRTVPVGSNDQHETLRLLRILSAWEITPPAAIEIKLFTDPSQPDIFYREPSERIVICHIGAGIAKKEWPVAHWAQLHVLAKARGFELLFSGGVDAREEQLVTRLRALAPAARILPRLDLARFLVALKSADAVISNDTGPMHFAAGLGIKTVAIFGPTPVRRWSPIGSEVRILQARSCMCAASSHRCHSAVSCLNEVTPEAVLENLEDLFLVKSFAGAGGSAIETTSVS